MKQRSVGIACLTVATALVTGPGCRCGQRAPAIDAGATAQAPPDAASAAAQARCMLASVPLALGSGNAPVEVGDAVATPQGFAVGVLRVDGAQTMAAIALTPAALGSVSFADVGPTREEAPVPEPFVRQGETYAVVSGLTREGVAGSRRVQVVRVTTDKSGAKAEPIARFDRRSEEPAALAAVSGGRGSLLAWDDDAPSHDHGVVEVSGWLDGPPGAPRTVSPDTTDADEPALAPRPGGYYLAWIARRPEKTDAGDTMVALEGPAEARDDRWIELVALDETGLPSGPVRALTATQGHISDYTLVPRAGDPATLDIFANDDVLRADQAGGHILHVVARVMGADPPVVLVPEGVGEGAPQLLRSGNGLLVAFVDLNDHTRALPLAADMTASGPASVESSLGEGAVVLGAAAPPDRSLAVQAPSTLCLLSCPPLP